MSCTMMIISFKGGHSLSLCQFLLSPSFKSFQAILHMKRTLNKNKRFFKVR